MDAKTNGRLNGILRLIKVMLAVCPSVWVVTLVLQWFLGPKNVRYPYGSILLGWGVWDFILVLIACVLVWRSLHTVREKGFFDTEFIRTLIRVKWLVALSLADELLDTVQRFIDLERPLVSLLNSIEFPLFFFFGLWVLIKIFQAGKYLSEEQKWMV